MADNTKIEWSDATWNPVTGCTKVSAGCDNCYAETFAERWRGTPGHYFEQGFDVQLRPDKLDQPMHWKKPRKVFVNSMSDLFHDSVPDRFIGEVFSVMGAAKQHTFQLLTKRHGRLRSLLNRWSEHLTKGCYCPDGEGGCSAPVDVLHGRWPLPNVHVGVSVENQQWADIRIPALLDTPAAVRWISAEPLLGPIELADEWLPCCCDNGVTRDENWSPDVPGQRRSLGDGLIPCGLCNLGNWEERTHTPLGWVVAGGESGPGARPMHPDWARSLARRCRSAGVPVFIKQMGSVWARKNGGASKGDDLAAWDEDLRIREFPHG